MLTSYELKYVSVHYGENDYRDNFDLIKTNRIWYKPWKKITTKTRVYKDGDYDNEFVDAVLYYADTNLPCELATRLYNS